MRICERVELVHLVTGTGERDTVFRLQVRVDALLGLPWQGEERKWLLDSDRLGEDMCDRCLMGCQPFVLGDESNAEVRETGRNIVDVLQEGESAWRGEVQHSEKKKGDDVPWIPYSEVKKRCATQIFAIGQDNIWRALTKDDGMR